MIEEQSAAVMKALKKFQAQSRPDGEGHPCQALPFPLNWDSPESMPSESNLLKFLLFADQSLQPLCHELWLTLKTVFWKSDTGTSEEGVTLAHISLCLQP